MRHRWSIQRGRNGRVCQKCHFTERTVRWLRSVGHNHRCTGREPVVNLA